MHPKGYTCRVNLTLVNSATGDRMKVRIYFRDSSDACTYINERTSETFIFESFTYVRTS